MNFCFLGIGDSNECFREWRNQTYSFSFCFVINFLVLFFFFFFLWQFKWEMHTDILYRFALHFANFIKAVYRYWTDFFVMLCQDLVFFPDFYTQQSLFVVIKQHLVIYAWLELLENVHNFLQVIKSILVRVEIVNSPTTSCFIT